MVASQSRLLPEKVLKKKNWKRIRKLMALKTFSDYMVVDKGLYRLINNFTPDP